MRPVTDTILSAGDMSQATLTSSTQDITWMFIGAIQAVWTGSPVGSLQVNGSNDGTNWSPVAGATQAVNGAGSVMFNVANFGFPKLQVVYTKTSGTGSLTVTFSGKGGA